MADERSRSPRKDFVWVKVNDGNPIMIMLSQLADPKNVFHLLEAVKTKESPKLDTVAIGDLQLFQNEGAKANGERCLRPGLLIGEVNGGNKDDNPLYIFHGAGSGEASQAKMLADIKSSVNDIGDNLRVFTHLTLKITTIEPVQESAAATQTRGRDWHQLVAKFYNFEECMVLSQLFPKTSKPTWFQDRDVDHEFKHASGAFPAVAEHIFPKGQSVAARAWDVEVHEASNGLLLLRHLERAYQAGQWSMLPVTEEGHNRGMFEIFVSKSIQEETIMYQPAFGKAMHRVKVRGEPLKFGSLDGKMIELMGAYKGNPSLRCLFLKAEMAHRTNGLPDPRGRLASYSIQCNKMTRPNWAIWRRSIPDPSLPVLQDVESDN